MKKYIVLLFFLFCSVLSVLAQENSKSDVVKWIDGDKYYIHTVAKGQGLFAIKTLYNIEEKDILEYNPEVFDGLKLGQTLKIPFKEFVEKTEGSGEYKIHVIESGQTIYSISKLYNVTQEDIFELNPETKNGYKINQKIKIPNEKFEEEKVSDSDSDNEQVYKVRRKDTLYGISKKFGVSQEALIAKNPIIAEEGLKRRQRIIIPKKREVIKEALFVPVDSVDVVNTFAENDSLDLVSNLNFSCSEAKTERHSPMNVVLMLPFELDILSFSQELEQPQVDFPKYQGKPFFEFYQSVLLSLKQLKEEGYKLNLYTFNTKRDNNIVKQLLQNSVFDRADLIIGPVYKPNFLIVQKFANQKNIPIVNPIKKGQNLGQYSDMVFDISPNENLIIQATVHYLHSVDTSKIFVVHSGGIKDLALVEKFHTYYPKTYVNANGETVSRYQELVFSDSRKIEFPSFLSKNKHNFVVVLSDEQAFVSNVYTRLNVDSENFSIQVLGRPKWEQFSNIDISYVHRLNTIRLQEEYVNYTDSSVLEYVKAYRILFKQEPGKYAFYAHDYTYNFVKYFYNWKNSTCLGNFPCRGFIFDMHLKRTSLGWKNVNFHYLRFTPDLTIEKVKV